MNTLGIFVKYPKAGDVKTRLASETSPQFASNLYERFLWDVTEQFAECGEQRSLCYTPKDDQTVTYFSNLSNDRYQLWEQPNTTLGERMQSFFSDQFEEEGSCAVLIGSDSPSLPGALVLEAFRMLDSYQVVLGPSTDGGYYLIGQQTPGWNLFEGIRWSEPTVFQQTLRRIMQQNLRLGMLLPWYDVDSLNDLEMLKGHLTAMDSIGGKVPQRTFEFLNQLSY